MVGAMFSNQKPVTKKVSNNLFEFLTLWNKVLVIFLTIIGYSDFIALFSTLRTPRFTKTLSTWFSSNACFVLSFLVCFNRTFGTWLPYD
jgi:hypothetical protein